MIRHIVMFRIPGDNAESDMLTLKDKLDALKNKITQIQYLKTGINISKSPSAYNLVLETEFKDMDDLELYRQHPDHVAILSVIKSYNCELAVVDYKI